MAVTAKTTKRERVSSSACGEVLAATYVFTFALVALSRMSASACISTVLSPAHIFLSFISTLGLSVWKCQQVCLCVPVCAAGSGSGSGSGSEDDYDSEETGEEESEEEAAGDSSDSEEPPPLEEQD
jgi:hypothetical protein